MTDPRAVTLPDRATLPEVESAIRRMAKYRTMAAQLLLKRLLGNVSRANLDAVLAFLAAPTEKDAP